MRALMLVVLLSFAVPSYANEKLVGSNVDVRTTIAFKVSDAAVQQLVPEGWDISPPAAGPIAGSNVFVVLIDSFSNTGAEGSPAAPFRGVVLAIPVKKKGAIPAVIMVVYGITAKEGVPGAYGNYVPGRASIERMERFSTDGKATADETWLFKTEDGNAVDVHVEYERGRMAQSKIEQQIHSGAKPEFFRIYRVNQVAEILRSTATGADRVSKFSFKATGAKLAPLFDGSERLIGIISTPSYSRTIFLPD